MYIRELRVCCRIRNLECRGSPEPIVSAQRAAEIFATILEHEAVEVCGLLLLSSSRHLTAYHELSRGTLDSTAVHPREVFKTALLANAAAVIVGHNHPSGDPSPSADDIALTRRLTQAGNIIGIPLLDHLVIGVRSHVSMREAGLI